VIYEKLKPWLVSKLTTGNRTDSGFVVIGAMSSPLKFLAIAENGLVRITPKGTVKIIYGYRLPALLSIFLVLTAFEFLIRRKIILTTFD
jgi:hypothetical protein